MGESNPDDGSNTDEAKYLAFTNRIIDEVKQSGNSAGLIGWIYMSLNIFPATVNQKAVRETMLVFVMMRYFQSWERD